MYGSTWQWWALSRSGNVLMLSKLLAHRGLGLCSSCLVCPASRQSIQCWGTHQPTNGFDSFWHDVLTACSQAVQSRTALIRLSCRSTYALVIQTMKLSFHLSGKPRYSLSLSLYNAHTATCFFSFFHSSVCLVLVVTVVCCDPDVHALLIALRASREKLPNAYSF